MRHIFLALISVGLLMSGPTATASSVPVKKDKVGLVLSGGGAKGIAHIGVLQALEDNHIPVDYITGTSMGAIVRSLYAACYSPGEMFALLAPPGFAA